MKRKNPTPELIARVCTEFNHYFRLHRTASSEIVLKMLRGVPNSRRIFNEFKKLFLKGERNGRYIHYMVDMGFILEPKMFWRCYDSPSKGRLEKEKSNPNQGEKKNEEEEYVTISLDELVKRLSDLQINRFAYPEKIGLKKALKERKYKFLEQKIIYEEL